MPEYFRPSSERVAPPEQSPELQEFLRATQEAYVTAQRYNGTEDSFRDLFAVLERTADAAQCIPGVTGSSLEREAQAAQMLDGELKGVDIQGLLAVAGERAEQRVRSAFDFKGTETPPTDSLFIKRVDGIILPPGDAPDTIGSGDRIWEPTRFEPRVQEIRELLESEGIFADDYVVAIGEVSRDMMREVSYAIIEIPRLQRTILVCDQVGEATFVLRGHFSMETLTMKTKEQLQNEFPQFVRRVVRRSKDDWSTEIKKWLLGNTVWSEDDITSAQRTKVDVRNVDDLRRSVLCEIPTAKDWIALGARERKQRKYSGLTIAALAKKFGLTHFTREKTDDHMRLAMAIYGQDNADIISFIEIEQRTAEEWKAAILTDPRTDTAEKWIALGPAKRVRLQFDGTPFTTIARIFGIVTRGQDLPELRMGLQIYGNSNNALNAAIHAAELRTQGLERTPDQWKAAILADPRTDTAEKWAQLRTEEIRSIQFNGVGITNIARAFGIEGLVSVSKLLQLQLGLQIYAPNNEVIQKAIEIEQRTAEQWREVICTDPRTRTAQDWLDMDSKGRSKLIFDGVGLTEIARKFDITGRVTDVVLAQLQLGLQIYAPNNEVIQKAIEIEQRTAEEWKAAILADPRTDTAEKWVQLGTVERTSIKFDGIGITRIGRIFDIDGSMNRAITQLQLGLKIYAPKNEVIQKAIEIEQRTAEEWKAAILADPRTETVEKWLALTHAQRRSIQFDGIGVNQIARLFGISELLKTDLIQMQFAQYVYGENDPLLLQKISLLQK